MLIEESNNNNNKNKYFHLFYVTICLTITIMELVNSGFYNFIFKSGRFLTIWSFNMVFLYSIWRFIKNDYNKNVSLFFSINISIQFVTTAFFWLFIFSIKIYKKQTFYEFLVGSFLYHSIPILYLIIEIFINKKIILKYFYVIYSLVIILIYFSVNFFVYYLIYDEAAYELVNFKDIMSLIVLLLGAVYVIIMNSIITYIKNNIINKSKPIANEDLI